MTPLFWAFLLLAVALGIIVIEMFVPSGGLLAILASVSVLAAVFIVFRYEGFARGVMFLLFTAALVPIVLGTAVKYWPHTTMGRRVLNLPPGDEASVTAVPDYESLQELVGQRGLAETKMIPSGSILLAGESYDAVSQSGAIQEGQAIQVIAVDGTRIMVRATAVGEQVPEPPQPDEPKIDDPFASDPFEEPLI